MPDLHPLYTLGYTGAKPDAILKFLIAHDAKLVDTRYSPFSRAPIWQKRSLMEKMGDRYVHMVELGNKNYKGQFGEGIMIADMDRGTLDLLKILKKQPAVLLCACPDYPTSTTASAPPVLIGNRYIQAPVQCRCFLVICLILFANGENLPKPIPHIFTPPHNLTHNPKNSP